MVLMEDNPLSLAGMGEYLGMLRFCSRACLIGQSRAWLGPCPQAGAAWWKGIVAL